MSQPFLLLVELIILGAAAYLFWQTRKAIADTESLINRSLSENTKAQNSGNNIAIAKDIAELLQELDAAANDMRSEWTRQSLSMQNLLKQSEKAQAGLNDLLLHYNAIQSATEPIADAPQSSDDVQNAVSMARAVSQTNIGEALDNYAQYLKSQDGRSAATTARIVGHLKNFALWWGGQRYEKVQLRRISTDEVDDYYETLQTQNLQKDTIRRKINAVKGFLDWIEPQMDLQVESTPIAPKVASPVHQTASSLIDRKKLVQALAAQGFDLGTIAAKTNMEREAVRMLLATRQK